ncbi:VWA domain-containing protein, partial [Neoasaia chiangmaiensis]
MNVWHNVAFAPSLPVWALAAFGVLSLGFCAYGLIRRAPGMFWRFAAMLVLLFWLSGPRLLHPVFRPVPQDVLMVVDHSPSMALRNRQSIVDETATALRAAAAHLPGMTLHTVIAHGGVGHGTRLFDALDQADLPQGRFSGAILLTDGMDHDVPQRLPDRFHSPDGTALPLHVLLSGRGEETDRRLRILQAPPFAIVGQKATLRVQVDDLGTDGQPHQAVLSIREGQSPQHDVPVTTGQPQDLTVHIRQPGEMLVGLSVSALPGEVSDINNRDVVRINGVRDRLKVLLVSGTPNQGERVWRSLLKADPSVDLVHFTILRPPDKDDGTPLSDLALIPFPIKELFQDRIRQFDLIILDGFHNAGILPQEYLANIADYVRGGGGLLLTAGPEFVEDGTLQDTPLNTVMPAHVPGDGVVVRKFQPQLTSLGRRHPVTAGLPDAPTGPDNGWGPWYRALRPDRQQGETLMNGPDAQPLLVLDRVDRGRVALLLSDQLWLWSRGEGGGGPQPELLRRLSHWLMKEPQLEENQLQATISDNRLLITRHTAASVVPPPARITAPDGHEQSLPLVRASDGVFTATLDANGPYGIWTVREDGLTAFAAPAVTDPIERRDLRATASLL